MEHYKWKIMLLELSCGIFYRYRFYCIVPRATDAYHMGDSQPVTQSFRNNRDCEDMYSSPRPYPNQSMNTTTQYVQMTTYCTCLCDSLCGLHVCAMICMSVSDDSLYMSSSCSMQWWQYACGKPFTPTGCMYI
jgi:hypothetical protein